jgi:hypothetical protein
MLTDDQLVALLSRDGSREDMLQEAARMGYQMAIEAMIKSPPKSLEKLIKAEPANVWTLFGI